MSWKMLLLGLLTIGLLAGGSIAVFAQSAAQPSVEPAASVFEQVADELENSNETEIIPEVALGEKLFINGGFRGIWGVWGEECVLDQCTEYPGQIAGLYGSVTRVNGTTYGFIGGVYTQKSGKLGGFLFGKYTDGFFWGRWHSATSDINGQFKITYDVNTNDVDAILNSFEGRWRTSDGNRNGYIKGRYSAKVSIQMIGRFGGNWAINDNAALTADMADGRLRGHYGVIRFADGTSIYFFRGGWCSAEGCAMGRLEGIGLNGNFYGIWHNTGGKPVGYLTGQYGENRFRGVWGNVGEEPRGSLWGRYGQVIVVEKEILPIHDEAELRPLSGEVQLKVLN